MSRRKFFCVTLVICSAVFCETSSIFDFLKRQSYSSSSHTTVPSSSRSDEQQNTEYITTRGPDEYSQYTTSQEPQSGTKEVVGRGGGWGWGGGGHDSSLDLYSLLGGLSFASLLGATIIYLARRNQQPAVMMMAANTSGRRRRRDLDDLDDELRGESIVEFLGRLGVHIDSPWWNREQDPKKVVPFKLT